MTLHLGDCLDVLPTLDAESIDAIVTDPPYGLEFMGKHWDHGLPGEDFWAAMLRVAKPGAHLLAFGGTRTYHRLASAIEDAGWEIRDTLVWAYASGFPKSLDVSKAIDKAAGAEREVVGVYQSPEGTSGASDGSGVMVGPNGLGGLNPITAPATDAAREWQGWGTALKPAWEPIVLARKPLRGTVAANVQAYGTGALNIDGCRIGTEETLRTSNGPKGPMPGDAREGAALGLFAGVAYPSEQSPLGRWPANVILTDPIFDGDTPGVVGGGDTGPAGTAVLRNGGLSPHSMFGNGRGTDPMDDMTYGDSGTYSRFFLVPKSSRSDREPVLGGQLIARVETAHRRTGSIDTPYLRGETPRENAHPTVKPTDLMRHLVRLVTPPGGLVLDPFMGSGTTALACEMEGFRWVGIEREAEYVAIAEARLNGTQRGLGLVG